MAGLSLTIRENLSVSTSLSSASYQIKRHQFEFGIRVGVSPVLFYDPVERVVATLHPNHTYEKVVFDPWQQVSYDVNDTVAAHDTQTGDPRTDPDIHGYVEKYFAALNDPTWKTWLEQRQSGAMGPEERGRC